jgi:hypothetical protein
MLPTIAARPVRPAAEVPLDIYAYSGEAALPEQVASIRSFLNHAGRPRTFTVVSDGTYTPSSVALLRALDDSVRVADASRYFPTDAPAAMHSYLTTHPTGKQLALIMSLPINGPALYVDSDVLFFRGASALQASAFAAEHPVRYLADCQLSGDERLFRSDAEKHDPVNTGVLLLSQKLDWSLSIDRFLALDGAPTFFTNQTMTHLTMHANGARPFDSRLFVLQLDDQFVSEDRYARAELVLRHYVNPVRHKLWTSLFR